MRTKEQMKSALQMAVTVWQKYPKHLPALFTTGAGVYSAALCKMVVPALRCLDKTACYEEAETMLTQALVDAIDTWSQCANLLPQRYEGGDHCAGQALAIAELCDGFLS
jgi:hypothetical protein